uniref:ubiquitin-like protein 3 n=1 Tax=Styela clava TaxID=7725 RepID=UPI0019395F4F|nr:ubiquitin-like protein 3 [Styela clava]
MADDNSTEAPSSSPKKNETNKDKIRLKLILVSGKTHEFYFTPNDTASDIGKYVFQHWPEHWEDRVDNHRILRLIYQGRFLHGNVSLGALKLPTGKLVVMHLVPRENLPEMPSQGERNREKSNEGGCTNCCTIQ